MQVSTNAGKFYCCRRTFLVMLLCPSSLSVRISFSVHTSFDSVHRETLWKIMKSYGIPRKLVKMVKAMHAGNQCAVVDSSGQTDWFTVASGVKQGCSRSGFLFLLVIDWITRATFEGSNTGIRWKMCSKLDELDFADGIALISSTREQIQQKVRSLSTNSKGIGWVEDQC